jgi:hypothetical protein
MESILFFFGRTGQVVKKTRELENLTHLSYFSDFPYGTPKFLKIFLMEHYGTLYLYEVLKNFFSTSYRYSVP